MCVIWEPGEIGYWTHDLMSQADGLETCSCYETALKQKEQSLIQKVLNLSDQTSSQKNKNVKFLTSSVHIITTNFTLANLMKQNSKCYTLSSELLQNVNNISWV
jgi:hypothetical protein